MNDLSSDSLPRAAAWLGYGGLLPFVGLALLIRLDPHHGLVWGDALVAYGAVILSFVGALHWGFAMALPDLTAEQRRACFIWSTVPALIAWPAILLMPRWPPRCWSPVLSPTTGRTGGWPFRQRCRDGICPCVYV